MAKQIRPLVAFKKENPEIYNFVMMPVDVDGLSVKQQENEFYWMYAYMESRLIVFNHPEGIRQEAGRFFWKDEYNRNNKTTVTEMGRLLLTGWYYGIVEFTITVCQQIYNGWLKAQDREGKINDLLFAQAVKHIRENIRYYCQNVPEMKVYLLKQIFSEDVKKLLPEPPESVQIFNLIISDVENYIKNRSKEQLYREIQDYEDYTEYLQEILNEYGIENYLSKSDYTQQQETDLDKEWIDKWCKEVDADRAQYDLECKEVLLKSNLLTAGGRHNDQ